jgi:hypothetical protein
VPTRLYLEAEDMHGDGFTRGSEWTAGGVSDDEASRPTINGIILKVETTDRNKILDFTVIQSNFNSQMSILNNALIVSRL